MKRKRLRIYSSQSSMSGGGLSHLSSRRKFSSIKRKKTKLKETFHKVVWSMVGFIGIFGVIGTIGFLFYLQRITNELPSVENPFKSLASSTTIYDRTGVELYKVSGKDVQRDLLTTTEYVPEALKWSVISAEDGEFYQHKGFDFIAIMRCAFNNTFNESSRCGGSTITQQVIKNTQGWQRDNTITRKIKELILSMQLERKYDKDEILNIYLNIVPQGSSVLGLKSGAKFYYNKKVTDLTLAEMSVLAAIGQLPPQLSPTVGTDIEGNKLRLYARTEYIFNQMISNLDNINNRIYIANEKNKGNANIPQQEYLTKEQLQNAITEVKKLEFRKPMVDIKAPHFVFYVQKLLTQRNYNNGQPFTTSEIETGGFKIYTTLDYSLQEIAEEYVASSEANHAGFYRDKFGAKNSALMTLRPSTGEILTMVGSKCYNNNEYIKNCDELDEKETTQFDPKVNVLDTLQSPGSTAKLLGYMIAFEEGVVYPGNYVPDVPIDIGGYRPKNWDGGFSGMVDVRYALAKSLNIPPLFLIQQYGVEKYVQRARDFGYTTFDNPNGYGPSITIGGGDVKAIEHAQGIGVFANGGNFVEHEVILKIEDKDGNIIYEHKVEPRQVADPKPIYLVNNVLNPRGPSGSLTPTKALKDRDVAGKTGTSENNRDTWYTIWSPDFVTVGWMGNNDNSRMAGGAFGSSSAEPWIGKYMEAIQGAFPEKTPFQRPEGIFTGGGYCKKDESCSGDKKDLMIQGKVPPSYLLKKEFEVCVDQTDKLARQIDKELGFAVKQEFNYLTSPFKNLQSFVDKALNKFPQVECDIPRDKNGGKPTVLISKPTQGSVYDLTMEVEAKAYVGNGKEITKIEIYLDNMLLDSVNSSEYSNSFDVVSLKSGKRTLSVRATDSEDETTTEKVTVVIGKNAANEAIGSIVISGDKSIKLGDSNSIQVVYDGLKDIGALTLYLENRQTGITVSLGQMTENSNKQYSHSWTPNDKGTYNLYAVANADGNIIKSGLLNVEVN
ncbi:transglycosylase domain-containing protein [Candidatus Dojkabacteria bacterium]|nr:transglycosylase domain-containing protein [Candidatus Dojkabacteria bacterium]